MDGENEKSNRILKKIFKIFTKKQQKIKTIKWYFTEKIKKN